MEKLTLDEMRKRIVGRTVFCDFGNTSILYTAADVKKDEDSDYLVICSVGIDGTLKRESLVTEEELSQLVATGKVNIMLDGYPTGESLRIANFPRR